MGGNALKNTNTRRYLRDEYEVLSKKIIHQLEGGSFFKGRMRIIPSYAQKESFGDLDLLVENTEHKDSLDIVEYLRQSFGPNELIANGSVISINVEELQTDFLICEPELFEVSLNYFSFNDLGNLMGRIAHKMGLNYGHDGLSYSVYHKENDSLSLGKVFLSTNSEEIFEFLGFDYQRFVQGFSSLQDIFEYVAKSRYFDPDFFDLEKRDYRSRVRDQKRSTYNGFLTWMSLQDFNVVTQPDFSAFHKARAHAQWSHAIEDEHRLYYLHERKLQVGRLFNPKELSTLLEKDIRTMVPWMDAFWLQWDSRNSFEEWITKTPHDEVVAKFVECRDIQPLKYPEKALFHELTQLKGSSLQEFMTRFTSLWETPELYKRWLLTADDAMFKNKVVEVLDAFAQTIHSNALNPK